MKLGPYIFCREHSTFNCGVDHKQDDRREVMSVTPMGDFQPLTLLSHWVKETTTAIDNHPELLELADAANMKIRLWLDTALFEWASNVSLEMLYDDQIMLTSIDAQPMVSPDGKEFWVMMTLNEKSGPANPDLPSTHN